MLKHWFYYGFIGISAGVLSGLFGVGGGILLVPMLIYFFKYSQHKAQGISLAVMLLPISVLAIWNYHSLHPINPYHVFLLSIGFVAGGAFGGRLALKLPQVQLKKIFSILLIIIGIKMLL